MSREPLNNPAPRAFLPEKPQIVWCEPSDSSHSYGRGSQRARCGFSGETLTGRAFAGAPPRFVSLIWNDQTALTKAAPEHPAKAPSRPCRVIQRFPGLIDRTSRVQHGLVALFSVWLIATSPWIAMRRIVPESATFWDRAHIGLGLVLTLLAVTCLLTNIVGGRWRQYFPWATGHLAEVRSDLAGIAHRRIPAVGGAGLFSLIQGLLLIGMLATALTGLGWLQADGARVALAWRDWHVVIANGFAWLLVVHVVTSALHLLDFLID